MNYFDEYVSTYDMNDDNINYKYYHSYRVMDIMELLATKLKFNYEDTKLAKVIGLLHDIGRFEQDKLYNSFSDIKMDHGNYGVTVLKDNNILDKFDIDDKDYEVVYKAIDNHNQFKINDGLTERELLFSKLIRDADKLDILYALGNPELKILKQDDKEISKNIENDFLNKKPAKVEDRKCLNDNIALIFCFIHDINFKDTFKIIKENKYYDKIYERINRKDIFKKYIEYTNKYIEERID